MTAAERVLVTGGGGYLGSQVIAALAERGAESVVCLDVRELPPERRRPGVVYAAADIRDRAPLEALLREHRIDTVVHLAAIVTPGPSARALRVTSRNASSIETGSTRSVKRPRTSRIISDSRA